MSVWKGEWENVVSGKQMDSVQEATLAVLAETQIDGRKLSKGIGPRGESPSGRKGQKACKSYLKGTCTNPSCNYWHPPVCQNYNI